MEMLAKRYLGDSVYVEVESGMLKLTTSNGEGDLEMIYLEVEVYEALVAFYEEAALRVRQDDPHPPDCLCDPCTCSRCGKHTHEGKCA